MNDIEIVAQFRHLIAEFKENEKRFALAVMNVMNGDFKEIPVFKAVFISIHKAGIQGDKSKGT